MGKVVRPTLTDRQQVLFDRLVTLGEWARTGELPTKVVEIRGFGSFFRGKPRPTDVDLIVRVQRQPHLPTFNRFIKLVDAIDYDYDVSDRFPTPAEAVAALHAERDPLTEGISTRDAATFARWLEPYSWNMLRPQTIIAQVVVKSPETYSERMIKRHLPKLNVVHWLNADETNDRAWGLRCGFTVSVWSEQAPDAAENLSRLLSEEMVAENLSRELAFFDVQLPLVRSEVAVLERQIDLLFEMPPMKEKNPDDFWFEKWAAAAPELAEARASVDAAKQATKRFDEQEWGRRAASSSLSRETLAAADAKRAEIKGLYQRMDKLEDLRQALCFSIENPAGAKQPRREFVVETMLGRGSAREREKTAAFLREIGLPVK